MKKIIFFILSHSIFNLVFFLKNRDKLKILAYHGVDDQKQFRKQIEYLSKHYSFISLQDLINYYQRGLSLPRHPLLVTFDDGKKSVFDKALPELVNLDIPAVVFVCPEIIDRNVAFWWEIMESTGNSSEIERIKRLPWDESEKIVSEKAREGKNMTHDGNMSWTELGIIHEKGISVANHTMTHPILPNCSESREFYEIDKTRTILNKKGFLGNILAYPNGDYSDRTVENARNAGIELAFTFNHSIVGRFENTLTLSRLRMRPSYCIDRMSIILSGFYPYLLRLLKKIRY